MNPLNNVFDEFSFEDIKENLPAIKEEPKIEDNQDLLNLIKEFPKFSNLKIDQQEFVIRAIYTIHKRLVKKDLTKQTFVINGLEIKDDGNFILLVGKAGTGKSYCISFILEFLSKHYPNIIVSGACPTWNATEVLQNYLSIEIMTMASLHGLRADEEMSAITFQTQFQMLGEKRFNEASIFIFDEVSMWTESVTTVTKNEIDSFAGGKIGILIGDWRQLPPVETEERLRGKASNAFLLTENRTELNKPARQSEKNSVLTLADAVIEQHYRQDIISWINSDAKPFEDKVGRKLRGNINSKGEGYIIWDNSYFKEISQKYNTGSYIDNPNLISTLCYTNEAVANANKEIRKVIFPNSRGSFDIQVNEVLRAYTSINIETRDKSKIEQLVKNRALYKITEVGAIETNLNNLVGRQVTLFNYQNKTSFKMFILDSESFPKIIDFLEPCYKIKRGFYVGNTFVENDAHDWKLVYSKNSASYKAWKHFMNNNITTCDIFFNPDTKELSPLKKKGFLHIYKKTFLPAYAGTVHTAQGNSYEYIGIDFGNLMTNSDDYEFCHLLYTALTRIRKTAIIYNFNY